MKKNLLIIVGIAVATLAIAVFMYWKKNKVAEAPAQTPNQKVAEDTTNALNKIAETPKITVPTNPIDNKIPELNPVEKTNPFNVYQNPFK